jgi:hypothetical protein
MEGLRNHSEANMQIPEKTLIRWDDSDAKPLNPQLLLSRDEVEALFGIPKRFLELAAGKKNGPIFVKIGRLTRYRVQDVEAWISNNRYASIGKVAGNKDGF